MPPLTDISVNQMVQNSSGNFIKKEIQNITTINQDLFFNISNKWFFKDTLNSVKEFARDTASSNLPSDALHQIAHYIGLSTLVHATDGWVFLSRAMGALTRGDIPSAIHLVYYSELRAVMSLLATKGIGVFKNIHIGIDSQGNAFQNKTHGTHSFVATALNEVIKERRFATEIFNDVNVFGVSLDSIINYAGYNATGFLDGTIAANFFEGWGIDISLSNDQNLRNEASYRPRFERCDVTNSILEKVLEIWEALEPFGSSSFYKLDIAIALITVKQIANATGKPYSEIVKKLKSEANDSTFGNVMDLKNHKELWVLTHANADKNDVNSNFISPIPMFCRAILLNRLATGQAKNFFPAAADATIEGWMQRIMIRLGTLDPTAIPDSMDYLYEDVKEASTEVKASMDLGLSMFDLSHIHPLSLVTLSQFERVPLWGFQ